MGRLDHRGAVLAVDLPTAGKPSDPVLRQVLAGEHRHHSRRARRLRRVDAKDSRVRLRGAHDVGVELARPVDVVGVAPLAREEAGVFLAPDRGADSRVGHRQPPISRAAAWTAFTMLW